MWYMLYCNMSYVCMCVYIYTYIHTYIHTYMYISYVYLNKFSELQTLPASNVNPGTLAMSCALALWSCGGTLNVASWRTVMDWRICVLLGVFSRFLHQSQILCFTGHLGPRWLQISGLHRSCHRNNDISSNVRGLETVAPWHLGWTLQGRFFM